MNEKDLKIKDVKDVNVKNLTISISLLVQQIHDLLESNMPEDSKAGLHNLMGAIRDCYDEKIKTVKLNFIKEARG